ncbi:MAG: hypothetical protein IRZ02_03110, partial [Acidothermus sp.]|nr:hypothetical protein [Acidothermus sp.]
KYAGSALRGECPTLPVTEGLVFRSCFTQSGDKSNNRVFLEPGRYAVVLLCESGGQATYAAKGLPGTPAVTAVCGKDNIGLAGFFTSDQEQEVIVEVSYEGSGEGVGQLVKLP